jgi:selenocysteine lyase/cysteine desulfurase
MARDVVPAASYGLSTAARAIEPQLRAGDRIVVVAEEFPRNICRDGGLHRRSVQYWSPSQLLNTETGLRQCWTESTKASGWSRSQPVTGPTGPTLICARSAKRAATQGSVLVIDATQTLCAMPYPITEVEPDFLVAAGYKWLLCPYGLSQLYVFERWRNSRP